MDKRIILSKDIKVVENEVIITETVETRMNYQRINDRIREVQNRQIQLKEQNKDLLKDYNEMIELEIELKSQLEQLQSSNSNDIEEI